MDSFTSFSSLITVAKTSKTMLNDSGESGHLCLLPDLRGNAFSFSPLRLVFAVGLSCMGKEMATHSSILVWRIPWTEELGRMQSMVSQRVRHD